MINLKNILNKKANITEAVYDNILKAVPDSYSYKKLAVDIAKLVKDEYGSHNIKPFMREIGRALKEGINEGRPIPMDTPNEFAYLDYKKWAYKYRAQYKKDILKIGDDVSKIFNAACSWWIAWANKNNKEFTHIKDRQKFGRALVIMMKDDDIVFSKAAWKKNNRITNLK